MSIAVAEAIVFAVQFYLGVGLAFACVFVWLWVHKVDPNARKITWPARLLLIPGCAWLWPLLVMRLARAKTAPAEKNAHRLAVLQPGRGSESSP